MGPNNQEEPMAASASSSTREQVRPIAPKLVELAEKVLPPSPVMETGERSLRGRGEAYVCIRISRTRQTALLFRKKIS
jgi:hypothetical protein